MTVVAIILASGVVLGWMVVRRCPLARAVSRQINQIAASSR